MSYALVLVLLAVGTCLSAPTDTTPTRPCCQPRRYQARLVGFTSPADSSSDEYLYIFDADKKASALVVKTQDGSRTSFLSKVYTDYSTLTTYAVSPDGANCTMLRQEEPYYQSCFEPSVTIDPSTFTYLEKGSVGPFIGGVEFDAWVMYQGITKDTLVFSKDSCYPILSDVQVSTGTDGLFVFSDVSETIANPDFLTMPPACKNKI